MSDQGSLKRALVTGGSRGIGKAICRALARDGWTVYINFKDSREEALALAREIGGAAVQTDVADPAAVKAMFEEIGSIDLLVCNAGVACPQQIQDVSDETWRRVFGVNIDGAFYCIREATPGMIRRKAGSILLITSVCGVYGSSCEGTYSSTKGALISLTKTLGKELGPSGIRVNAIAPGFIETDMTACFSSEEKAVMAQDTPLRRLGQPEDVAELAAFLASDRASFITGQIIGCDGGFQV